jgi:probable HAF family extracellular repeat protein
MAVPVAAETQGWMSADVGALSISGTSVDDHGVWTIQGAGADIWGTADAFQFLSRQTTALNVRLVVQVDDLQNTNPFAKSGLMLRSSLDPAAATAILDMKPSGEIEFMLRGLDGGQMVYRGGAFATTPVWLRIDYFSTPAQTVEAFVSTDGITWMTINLGGNAFALPSPYYAGVAVTSHDDHQSATSHVEGLSFVPFDWTATDVGATGLTGNTVVVNASEDAFSMQGAGRDIWGTADAFQFLYQDEHDSVAGIQARVVTQEPTNGFAKVGVMLRNSLRPDGAFVILDMMPSGELEFMWRSNNGTEVQYLGGATAGFTWLRLLRDLSEVSASASGDGVTWTQVGMIDVEMPTTGAKLGIVVTSHDTSLLNTAVVDNVTVVNQPPDQLPPQYALVDLGTLGGTESRAFAINESGQVVGWSTAADKHPHAFVWTVDKGIVDLGARDGDVESAALAINDAGLIVGSSARVPGATAAVAWTAAGIVDLGRVGCNCPEYLAAYGVNAGGAVVGESMRLYVDNVAFVWQQGVLTPLFSTMTGAESGAFGLNDAGQVVGFTNTRFGSATQPAVWSDGMLMLLGTLGGSSGTARAINAWGGVVGEAGLDPAVPNRSHAFYWAPWSGMADLGTLGGVASVATAINGNFIVGQSDVGDGSTHGFIYDLNGPGTPVDLNDLVATDAKWTIASASGINGGAAIVGWAANTEGVVHAVLLLPQWFPVGRVFSSGVRTVEALGP